MLQAASTFGRACLWTIRKNDTCLSVNLGKFFRHFLWKWHTACSSRINQALAFNRLQHGSSSNTPNFTIYQNKHHSLTGWTLPANNTPIAICVVTNGYYFIEIVK